MIPLRWNVQEKQACRDRKAAGLPGTGVGIKTRCAAGPGVLRGEGKSLELWRGGSRNRAGPSDICRGVCNCLTVQWFKGFSHALATGSGWRGGGLGRVVLCAGPVLSALASSWLVCAPPGSETDSQHALSTGLALRVMGGL